MEHRVELIWANRSQLQTGQVMQPHYHACHQLYYILSGSAVFLIGSQSVQATPDSCFLVPAGTLHQNMPRRPKTWTDHVAELEAFGRVMTGLGPWLELPDDETREGALRATAQNGNRIWHEMR